MIQDLKLFYADSFTGGDENKAKNILELAYTEIRRADALKISFWTGGTIVMTMFSLFFLFIPSSDSEDHFRDLFISLAVLRVGFMLIFMIAGSGVAIQIFNYHSINWLYLFEVDPHAKMTNA